MKKIGTCIITPCDLEDLIIDEGESESQAYFRMLKNKQVPIKHIPNTDFLYFDESYDWFVSELPNGDRQIKWSKE